MAFRQRYSNLNTNNLHNLSGTLQAQTSDYNLTNVTVVNFTGTNGYFKNLVVSNLTGGSSSIGNDLSLVNLRVSNSFTGSTSSFNNLQVTNSLSGSFGNFVDLIATSPGYTTEILNSTTGGIISLNTAYSQINNYTFYATGTPVYTLATGTTDHIKYIGLNNGKNAPQQITTNQGSFEFIANIRENVPSMYINNVWQFFDNPIQNTARWFPTQQQGSRLLGTTNGHVNNQGKCVALSADGNILAVGTDSVFGGINELYVFTRTNNVWDTGNRFPIDSIVTSINSISISADGTVIAMGRPQDNGGVGAVDIVIGTSFQTKLIASDSIGNSAQGSSVSLSSDGNILAIGGNADNSDIGATWIWQRINGVWTQQVKLIGSGGITTTQGQGQSVSLSSDGTTLAVGGYTDNSGIGAVWIFTQNNGIWNQQGSKLTVSDGIGTPNVGSSVSLSANGNILAIGALNDNSSVGATWIFTRNNGNWTQQVKLIANAIGNSQQGIVSLSADGNTLAVGATADNGGIGANFIFINNNGTWVQKTKLVAVDLNSFQGTCVSLSANGNTLASGSPNANSNQGGVAIFV